MKLLSIAFFFISYLCSSVLLFGQSAPIKNRSETISNAPNDNKKQQAGNTYAIVIGISNYTNTKLKLDFADKDALAFAHFLRTYQSIPITNIKLLINQNATYHTITTALDSLNNMPKLKTNDKVIFYFAGHAKSSDNESQEAFLLLSDYSPDMNTKNKISLKTLQYALNLLTQKAKVVCILDACHSGELSSSEMNKLSQEIVPEWKNQIKILSCKPNEKSIESPRWGNGRGLFSYYLIKGLEGSADLDGNGYVVLYELEKYIKEKVRVDSDMRQNPEVSGESEELMSKLNLVLDNIKTKNKKQMMFTASVAIGAAMGAFILDQRYRSKRNNFETIALSADINGNKTILSQAEYDDYKKSYNEMIAAQNQRWLWWSCIGLSAGATAYGILQKVQQKKDSSRLTWQPSSQSIGVSLTYTFHSKLATR